MSSTDYLTVCDVHPMSYVSAAALTAALGEDEEAIPFNAPLLKDYEIVGTRSVGLRWMTLRQLADEMECTDREVASLAHHLASAVNAGFLERKRVPVTIRGKSLLRWCYRRTSEELQSR